MRRAAYLFAIVLLATLAACGRGLPKNPESGAPVIDAKPLPTAITEEAFNVELTATGGEKPLEWSIESVPGELSWLTIDPATGVLGGTPTEAFDSTVAFVAKVKAAKGRVDSKPFALEVRECLNDGDSKTCYGSDGSSCFTSSSTCSGGKLAACTGGTPSIMFDHCGAGEETKCGVCSAVNADACDGVCKCGGSTACGGDLPDCCDSICTNRASDKNHCGACETVCQSGPQNSERTCEVGVCGWKCRDGFTQCGEACVDLKADPANCGGCRSTCSSGWLCSNGQCAPNCSAAGQTNCSGSCVDLPSNVSHCGTCENACAVPLDGSVSCTGGECVPSCGSFSLCSGSCLNLSNDASHCGNCSTVCSGPTSGSGSAICSGGSCDIQCDANTMKCGTNCCSAPANGTAVCNGTSCDVACNPGYTKCGTSCVLLGTTNNCSGCGNSCSTSNCSVNYSIVSCVSGGCQCSCPSGNYVCTCSSGQQYCLSNSVPCAGFCH